MINYFTKINISIVLTFALWLLSSHFTALYKYTLPIIVNILIFITVYYFVFTIYISYQNKKFTKIKISEALKELYKELQSLIKSK